ncbi:MAG: carboxypeptidase regulatory-like domain-containing protein [Candidatus Diapherotrites archaeon]
MTDGFGSSDSEKKAEKQRILDQMKNNLSEKPSSFAGSEKAPNPKVQEDAKWLDNEGKRLFKKSDDKPMPGKSDGIKYRNPILVILLTVVTLGIYGIYWMYKTKKEINSLGAKIPNIILLFIPLIQLFFIYKYADGYAKFVKKDNKTIIWLLLFIFLSPIAVFLFQSELNNYSNNPPTPKAKKEKISKAAPIVGLAAATKSLDKKSNPLSGIMSKLKSIYYAMEDKYYEMLDKIDPVIPIYKVVDPIDKVFPSFILFLLLILLLLLLLCWLIFGGLASPAEFAAGINVVKDSPEQEGLADAHVIVEYENILLYDGYTDGSGKISDIKLASESISAYVTVSKSGYNDFQSEILLENGKTAKIQLTPMSDPDAKTHFKIYVEDLDTGERLQGISVTMEFSCSNGTSAPARDTTDTGYFSVYVDRTACGTLTATVMATGYETLNSQRISSETEYLKLQRSSTESNLVVNVYDSDGEPVEDVAVRLYDEETPGLPVGVGNTDSFGSFIFETIDSGTYKVTALHDDGRYAEKLSVVVGSGQTQYANLTLGILPPGGSKKLFIKVIDGSNINEPDPIENVKVLVYINKSRVDTLYTDADGIVEKFYDLESTLDHIDLVLLHDEYLVKIHPGIELVSANSNTPKEIKMYKISGSDYAIVNVEVLSYGSNEPVEEAKVYLYEADTNLMVHENPRYTDDEGLSKFEYLPDSSYFAIAKDDFTGTEGTSDTEAVLRGEEITLSISLVLGMGNFKVTIVDEETNEPITLNGTPLVSVKQYDPVTDEISDTNKTYHADDKGVVETDDFSIDKKYILELTHDDYQSYETEPLQPIDNITVEPTPATIALIPKSAAGNDEIGLQFGGIYKDDELEDPADKVESGKTYYLKYILRLPKEGTYYDISQYIIVGSDLGTNLPSSGYVIKIKNVIASGFSDIVLSNCYSASDPYINPSSCQGVSTDAKKAGIYWNELNGEHTYYVTAEVWIESGLEDGTLVSTESRAKTTYDNSEYETPKLEKNYNINEAIDCTGPNCPKFSYRFKLTGPNPTGDDYSEYVLTHYENEKYMPDAIGHYWKPQGELPDISTWLPAFVQKDYLVKYAVTNISEEQFNVTLIFDLPQMGIHEQVHSGTLPVNGSLNNNNSPWSVTPPFPVAPGVMIFNVTNKNNPDEIYGRSIMFFKILNGNMNVDVKPNVITPESYPKINVTVTGEQGNPDPEEVPLPNASVKIQLRRAQDGSVLDLVSDGLTNLDGTYSYNANTIADSPLPKMGDTYIITVIKQGYLTQTVKIPVNVSPTGNFNPAYGCISVEPEFLEIDKSGVKKTFIVKTTNRINGIDIECNEAADMSFATKLKITDLTAELKPGEQKQFTITVPKGLSLGLYPIYILAQFKSDDQVFHADTIKTNITDPSGSCLWKINPLIYDFIENGEVLNQALENMTIYNQCQLSQGIDDVFMPSLASDSAKISLNPGQQVPLQMRFNWTVKVNADNIEGELPLDTTIIFPGREASIEKIHIGNISVVDLMATVSSANLSNITFTPIVKEITEVIPNKPITEYCNSKEKCIDIWLEGRAGAPMLYVYASYRGKDTHRTGDIISPVYNVSVTSNDYVMITANDYVSEIK